MNLLLTLASLLGIEIEVLKERVKKDVAAWLVVASFAGIGVVFLLVALHAWLVTVMGPIWAPLAIAGGALLIALIVFFAMRMADAAEHRRSLERKHNVDRTALVTTAAIAAFPLAMNSDLMKKVGLPIGGALAAAYLLRKPGRHHSTETDTPS
ncbi:phage holin family protein [Devosia sp.]|uniref:phage holin family protein n=1 Tax=Devosia sp. TaxID=1871048 RepID=UPI003BADBE25